MSSDVITVTPNIIQANIVNNSFGLPSTSYNWNPSHQAMSATGQYIVVVAFDTDPVSTKGKVFVSKNYGKTFIEPTGIVTITSNITWRGPSISSNGQYIIVFNTFTSGSTPIYYSNNFGDSFISIGSISMYFMNKSCISDDGQKIVFTSPKGGQNSTSVFIGTFNGTTWTWNSSNPSGTLVDTIDCAINSTASIIYISAASGLYKSTNYGSSWSLIDGTLGLPTGTGSQNWNISMTKDGTKILVAKKSVTDSTGGVYLSTNSGVSFSLITGLPNINTVWNSLAISTDGQYMAAGYGYGSTQSSPFYYSFDSGVTWNAYSSGLRITGICIQNLVLLFTTTTNVYIGNISSSTIIPNTWTNIDSVDITNIYTGLSVSSDGKTSIASSNLTTKISNDYGITWNPLTTIQVANGFGNSFGLPTEPHEWNPFQQAMSATGQYIVLVAYDTYPESNKSKVFVSNNYGKTFSQPTGLATTGINWRGNAISSSGQYIVIFAVSANPVIMWYSINYGVSFTSAGSTGSNYYMNNSCISDDGQTVVMTTPGSQPNTRSVFIGKYNGSLWTWNSYNPGGSFLSTNGCAMNSTASTIYIGSNALYRSTDGGFTWINLNGTLGLPTGTQTWFIAMTRDGTRIIAAKNNVTDSTGGVYLSTNSGASFSVMPGLPTINTQWDTLAISTDGRYMAAGYGYGSTQSSPFYYSFDSGVTWNAYSSGLTINSVCIQNSVLLFTTGGYANAAIASNVYIASLLPLTATAISSSGKNAVGFIKGERIYYSDTSGQTWIPSTTQPTSSVYNWSSISIDQTGQYALICENSGNIFYSDTSGQSWRQSSVSGISTAQNWTSISISGTNSIACIKNGKIYYSSNSGITFTVSDSIISNWNSVSISNNGPATAIDISNVYYSSNYGMNWTISNLKNLSTIKSVNPQFITSGSLISVAGFPTGIAISNTNWAYKSFNYGNGGSYIYYSNDYGRTWVYNHPGGYVYWGGGVVCSTDGKYSFFGSHYGLYVYNNYGNGGYVLVNVGGDVGSVACSATGQYVYVFVETSPGKYFYSTNYGVSFTDKSTAIPAITQYSCKLACSSLGNIVYFLNYTTINTLFKSTDYGLTFTALTMPITSTGNIISSISCNSDGSIIYLSYNIGFIYISKDFGSTWSKIYDRNTITNNMVYSITCNAVGNLVFACIYNQNIIYSNNYGITWSTINNINYWTIIKTNPNGNLLMIGSSYNNVPFDATYSITESSNYSVSISESGTYALTSVTANNIYYSDTSGQTWKSYNNQNNWSNSVLSRDGKYGLATADNKLYTLSLITPTTFPQPSLHYPFNISDMNINNQLQDWSSGSPVYNANMNTSYISKTNYKTGVGSLELPKNSISSIGTLYTLFTVTESIGIAVSQNQLKLVTCSLTTGSGKLQYSTRATTSDSYGALAQVQGTPTGGYSRVVLTSDGTRGIYCFGWGSANSNYVYFFTWTGAAPSIPIQTLDTNKRDYYGLAITPDGSRLVASTSTSVFFAGWNGSNYTAFTQTLEIVTAQLRGIGISTNGDRIVYGTGENTITWYISFWNGTNYNSGTIFRTITPGYTRTAYFSADSSLLFLSYTANTTSIEYGKYNPTTNTYDTFTSVSSVGSTQNIHGLCYIELNTTGNLYYANYGTGGLHILQFNYATAQTTNYVNVNTSNSNTNYTLSTSIGDTYIIGIGVSRDELKMVICFHEHRNVYYATRTNTNLPWSSFTVIPGSSTAKWYNIKLTPDGTRGVVCANNSHYVYMFTWTGAAPGGWQRIVDSAAREYYGVALTADGSRLVACGNFGVYYATWNGSNYTAFTVTGIGNNCVGITISANGDRIVYGNWYDTNNWYVSYWSGTNYPAGTFIRACPAGDVRGAFLSQDASLLFLSYYNNTSFSIEYGTVMNGQISGGYTPAYTGFAPIQTSAIPANLNCHSLCYVDNNTTGTIYTASYGTSTMYVAPFNRTPNNTGTSNQIIIAGTYISNAKNVGIAVSQDELKMVLSGVDGGIYYSSRTNKFASWPTFTPITSSSAPFSYYTSALTSDGTRGVTCGGYINYFTWTGSAPSAPSALTRILDTTARGYTHVSITSDGSKLVASADGVIYYTTWIPASSNYGTFTSQISVAGVTGVTISSNGDRIAYGDSNKNWYLSFWSGTSFPAGKLIKTSTSNLRTAHFSEDSSILFLSYAGNTSFSVEYGYYNSSLNIYDSFAPIANSLLPVSLDTWGLCYKNGNLYVMGNGTTVVYVVTLFPEYPRPFINGNNGITFSTWFRSNFNNTWARIFDFGNAAGSDNILLANYNNNLVLSVYRGTAVASQQENLLSAYPINDYKWYHIAFSLSYIGSNSPTANLIVYLNGQVISNTNNYTYPINIQRTLNYIVKSNWVDPQFFGSIDDFRIYNSVLSGGQIQHLYINTPIINSLIDNSKSPIYLLGNTSVDKASSIWGTATNMGTGYTYYYWNDPYAQTNAFLNYSNPILFSYTYTALSTLSSVKLYVMCDDIVSFKLNSSSIVLASTGWNIAVLATTINLISGNNIFEFNCINGGGQGMFAAYVTDSAGNYLFSTNNTKTGWTSKITGFFNNGIPLTSFIRNNSNTGSISITNSTYKCNEIVIFRTGQLTYASPYPLLNYSTNNIDLINVFYKNSNITYFNPTNMFYAFSVRLLVYSYTGAVFTLRRSSDNITSDFYTDNTQTYLTTGANNTGTTFTSWIGSSTAYVTKWYDQSGKDNHCTQATATIQPTLSFKNGKYVIQFNSGVGTFFNLTTASQPNTIFCHYYNTNTSYGSIIASGGDFGQRFSGSTATVINGDSNFGDWYHTQGVTKIAYNNGVSATTVLLNAWNSLALSTTSKVYTSGSFTKIGTDGYDKNRGMNGYMSEMIGHNTAMTADDAIAFFNNTFIILPFTITGNTNYIVSELNGYTIIKFKIGTFTVTPKTNVNIYQLFVVGGGGNGGSGNTSDGGGGGGRGGQLMFPSNQNTTVGSYPIAVTSENILTITVNSLNATNSTSCPTKTILSLTGNVGSGANAGANGTQNIYTNLYYGGGGGNGGNGGGGNFGTGVVGGGAGGLGGGGGGGGGGSEVSPAGGGSGGGTNGGIAGGAGGGGGKDFNYNSASGSSGGIGGGGGGGGVYESDPGNPGGGGGGGGGYYGGGGGGGGGSKGGGGGGGTGVVLLIYK